MQRKKNISRTVTSGAVQLYTARGSMSMKSISPGSSCAPGTMLSTGVLVPIFKELMTRSLFSITTSTQAHSKDFAPLKRETETLKDQAIYPQP